MKTTIYIILLSLSIIFLYSFKNKENTTEVSYKKEVAINNEFLSKEQLLARVMAQLNLKKENCLQDLIAVKVISNDAMRSVVVIPEIATTEEEAFGLNSHILVVNRKTGEIVSKFYESYKTSGWVYDGLKLDDIIINTGINSLKKDSRSFAIIARFISTVWGDPYEFEEISLFIEKGETLQRILDGFVVYSNDDRWKEKCVESKETQSALTVSKKTTNGYFDIIVNTQITHTNASLAKNGECDRKDVTTESITELVFIKGKYRETNHKVYYKNGKLKEVELLKDGKKSGEWIKLYPNGQVKEIKNYIGGISSTCEYYHENGVMYYSGSYIDDEPIGEQKTYYANAQLQEIKNYKYRYTLVGNYERYSLEGKLLYKTNFGENGTGKYKDFYTTDKCGLREEGNYINGVKSGEWIAYHENGKLKDIGYFVDGVKSGKWIEYHDNGKVKAKGFYTNNKKTGNWKWYYKNKELALIVNYKDGVPFGEIKSYYKNGNKKDVGHFDNNGKTGEWKAFDENEKLREEGNYKDNKLTGTWHYYHANGKLEEVRRFKEGKLTGELKSYYDNGQLKAIGNFINDKQSGLWKYYYKNGNIKETGSFKENNKIAKWKSYYEKGQPKEIMNYIDGKPDGQYYSFFIDGKKKTLVLFKDGKKLTYLKYYNNGQLKSKGNFEKKQPLGEWTTYYKNGVLKSTRVFKDGLTHDVSYYKNGNIKKIGSFKEANEIEQWRKYYENGQLEESKDYKDNKVVLRKRYYQNGKLKLKIINSDKERSIEHYDIDGKVKK